MINSKKKNFLLGIDKKIVMGYYKYVNILNLSNKRKIERSLDEKLQKIAE